MHEGGIYSHENGSMDPPMECASEKSKIRRVAAESLWSQRLAETSSVVFGDHGNGGESRSR